MHVHAATPLENLFRSPPSFASDTVSPQRFPCAADLHACSAAAGHTYSGFLHASDLYLLYERWKRAADERTHVDLRTASDTSLSVPFTYYLTISSVFASLSDRLQLSWSQQAGVYVRTHLIATCHQQLQQAAKHAGGVMGFDLRSPTWQARLITTRLDGISLECLISSECSRRDERQ